MPWRPPAHIAVGRPRRAGPEVRPLDWVIADALPAISVLAAGAQPRTRSAVASLLLED